MCQQLENQTGPKSTFLTGLLVDEEGNRYIPLHSVKKGRRYLYYVSQAVINSRKAVKISYARAPAQPIEDVVIRELKDRAGEKD